MAGEFSKPIEKKLRELVYQAHERALRHPLGDLAESFDRWRRGEIDAIDLVGQVHKFHDGPSRAIYKRFTWSRNDDLPMLVAYGVENGLLEANALPVEVREVIGKWLAFLRAR